MAVPPEKLISDRLEVGDNEGGDSVDSTEIAKKSGKLKS